MFSGRRASALPTVFPLPEKQTTFLVPMYYKELGAGGGAVRCVCTGAVVKEKGKSFWRAICVESKPIQVVWEFLKVEAVVFHSL